MTYKGTVHVVKNTKSMQVITFKKTNAQYTIPTIKSTVKNNEQLTIARIRFDIIDPKPINANDTIHQKRCKISVYLAQLRK